MMQGSEDALDVFVKAMSRLAAAANEDKKNGIEPREEESTVEKRLRGLLNVLRENADGSIVEEKLAMKLDQALKARGSTNVFEILRAEFVANALPVDGVLFERVATYAMQNY
ncbi:hypothetical protein DHOM_07025 [Dermabacter hominis 1368]|uniref:Uncharacterized protein n=2 Tax=Dermabacter TaxID=36739 RepID=A0ABR4SJ29_9MICO|nr:hypothetical protein DHOM_07025 [Dermabacter hominis 1368]